MTPRNASELVEYLRERFGLGAYDDTNSQPYWRYVQSEAAKINALCKRRRVSIEELHQAAEYAQERGESVKGVFDLLDLMPYAKRAARQAIKGDPRARLQAAAEAALEAGRVDWAQRLFAAAPERADEVLAQWEADR